MYSIQYLDNSLQEGILIRFSKEDSLDRALCALNQLAKDWDMRFVSDTSLFGGYYVRSDGICYFVR